MLPKRTSSDAERQGKQLQRIKADPVKHELYLKKQRDKYRERKERGAVKTIDQLSAREQRQQRKRWLFNPKAYRERNQRQDEAVAAVGTPPHTPTEDEVPDPHPKKRGRTRLKDSQRSKSYRRISHLENELEEKERVINRLRQQEYRRKTDNLKVPMDKQSPRTRSKSFFKKANSLKTPNCQKDFDIPQCLD